MSNTSKHRSQILANKLIAFSISYQPEDLLAGGMGLKHLRELLIQLARPFLQQGADLLYSGHWQKTEDNFTYDLLDLIRAEQANKSYGGPGTNFRIGKLYNFLSWPSYLALTPNTEAQWINCCRIVRITQQMAGLPAEDIVSDADAQNKEPRTIFNTAVTLSAMRRLSMEGMAIMIPDVPQSGIIPPVVARILLGGKVENYLGFIPGVFEEALVTIEKQCPLYVLGGFGGAAEVLARAILGTGSDRPSALTLPWHKEHNPALAQLLEQTPPFVYPVGCRSSEEMLTALFSLVQQARLNPAHVLNTGLSNEETRELLQTRSAADAVRLVRTGLATQLSFSNLPA
ncbi:MAG: hypothetical protein AB7G75_23700 [Candidatus Binatia bacterium]